jgi:D-alanyl-lipoteichoic acid acyltransferase DltB (MBOAT superfamily)
MSFQSLSFFIFLALTVLLCLSVGRKNKAAAAGLLLVACGIFYLWSLDRQALSGFLVLLGGAIVTYGTVTGAKRNGVYLLAACWHIGALLWFKCVGFFNPELYRGWMPLGLSFFTFQQLWLLHESYTGEVILRKQDGKDFLLYSFFFPSVTSGPILKPQSFFPQLKGEKFLSPDWQDVSAALYAITLGTAKKVLLADPLGAVVANGWAMTESLSAPGAWITMLAYTLQLYLDFSGYCDIAAGCARLFGIRLPVNFNSPYRSLSVGEFWKRWHITLTSFLRECLYIPLGGSRKGAAKAYLNIMIVFFVSGFWHGAGWTFIIWGGLHGLAQIAERAWGKGRHAMPKGLQWVMTFLFVNLAWVFFRAPSLAAAGEMFSAAVSGGWAVPLEALASGVLDSEVTAVGTLLPMMESTLPALVLGALLGVGMLVSLWPNNTIQNMEDFRPKKGTAILCGVLLVWAILSFSSVATFIYSNF